MGVFKRKVIYLGGFDPRGLRFYHQTYREQIKRYAALSGDRVDIGPRQAAAPHVSQWHIENHTQKSSTEYSFLRWEDIVNDRWERNPLRLAFLVLRTYGAIFFRDADWPKIAKLPRGPLVTLFYPLVFTVLLPLLIWLLLAGILGIFLPLGISMAAGLALSLAVAWWPLRLMKAPWLLRFFAFNHSLARELLDPDLDARIDHFANYVGQACNNEWDEILFITHSNGSILALPVLQRLLQMPGFKLPASFRFISLGQSIPLLAVRKTPNVVIAALRALAPTGLPWIDIGSPPDGAGFHGVNCYTLVGAKAKRPPVLLSPRFHVFYDAATYHSGLRNKYEIHFDYLRVGDRLSPLDYANITASARAFDASLKLFQALP